MVSREMCYRHYQTVTTPHYISNLFIFLFGLFGFLTLSSLTVTEVLVLINYLSLNREN